MADQLTNRSRFFASIISVDAWHDQLSLAKESGVNLYIDLIFQEARLGGESDSPVRFRLGLKRAELTIRIPETEPFSVDKRSIERFFHDSKGKRRINIDNENTSSTELKAGISLGHSHPNASVSLGGHEIGKTNSNEKITYEDEVTPINVVYISGNAESNEYRWNIETSRLFQVLSKAAWNPVETPLLKLIDRSLPIRLTHTPTRCRCHR